MGGMSKTVTIALATTIPIVSILAIAILFWQHNRRRNSRIFNRGITPIADEEIESWKSEKAYEDKNFNEEKPVLFPESTRGSYGHHANNSSVSSVQKPASVIVYHGAHYNSRTSGEHSPRGAGFYNRQSNDIPSTPILARAPNARPGLTDETVQGDCPFIPQVKRMPSRLTKTTPPSSRHSRHQSVYSNMGRDKWYGQASDYPSPGRQSADDMHRRGHFAMANMPRLSLDDGPLSPGGLSPRPLLHKSEIGRAIG